MRYIKSIIGIWALPLTIIVTSCGQGDAPPATAPDPQATPGNAAAGSISQLEKRLGPADVKTFGGSDKLPIGGPLASISIPQSENEKQLLAQFGCYDEVDCYGPKHFERYILKTYPDVGRVRFKLPPDIAGEAEYRKQDFRRGLYFAKLITLANGQSLYDFLTKCSKTVSSLNWAEMARDAKTDKTYFAMQYFPVLRQDASGDEFELDILLNRFGDRIDATSPAFSSSVLRDADFMTKHGVSCWSAGSQ
jgi:hypothetical protein